MPWRPLIVRAFLSWSTLAVCLGLEASVVHKIGDFSPGTQFARNLDVLPQAIAIGGKPWGGRERAEGGLGDGRCGKAEEGLPARRRRP